jgi:transaldolase
MRFFLDSVDPEEARRVRDWGLLDGATVSPGLISGESHDYKQIIRELSAVCDGPVLAEVTSTDAKGMYKEGREYHKLGKEVVIKLPMTVEGMKVLRLLTQDQIAVNITLCFSAAQALIAAKGGAAYVSPSIGRLDDIGSIGMDLIEQIIRIYDNFGYQTQIVVSDVRNPVHLLDAALMGADVATMPFAIIEQLLHHPLTERGLARTIRGVESPARKHP